MIRDPQTINDLISVKRIVFDDDGPIGSATKEYHPERWQNIQQFSVWIPVGGSSFHLPDRMMVREFYDFNDIKDHVGSYAYWDLPQKIHSIVVMGEWKDHLVVFEYSEGDIYYIGKKAFIPFISNFRYSKKKIIDHPYNNEKTVKAFAIAHDDPLSLNLIQIDDI